MKANSVTIFFLWITTKSNKIQYVRPLPTVERLATIRKFCPEHKKTTKGLKNFKKFFIEFLELSDKNKF